MSGNALDWRSAPVRTKRLAGVAVALIVFSIYWILRFSAKERLALPSGTAWLAVGFAILAIGVVMIAVLCVIEFRRLHSAGALRSELAPPFAHPWPIEPGVRWIAVEPSVYERARRLLITRIVAAALIVVLGFLMMFRFAESGALRWFVNGFFLSCAAFACTGLLFEIRAIRRARSMRLGTDGINALFDPGSGVVEQVGLDTVRVSNFSILLGRRIVTLTDAWHRTHFPPEELRGILLSRLHEDAFVKPGGFILAALRRGNPGTIASALGVIAIIALMLIVELQPASVEAAMRSFAEWLIVKAR